jgi:hypothetical protein
MKFYYRRPSLNTMLGITKAKKQFNKATGYTAAMRPFRVYGNAKRRVLRRAGYYSEPMKMMRYIMRMFK